MSIWNASIETANTIYSVAYVGLIVGAIITTTATMALFWSSAIRDQAAQHQIAAANNTAAHANERAAALEVEAANAQLEQDRIRQENLQLSIEFEKERAARLNLEGKLASRRLSPEQKREIIQSMEAEGEKIMVSVTKLGDSEAGRYADELITAFEEAGAFVTVNVVGIMAPPRYGVVVSPRFDTPISRALNAAGIQFQKQAGNLPAVLVGLKPPPF